MSRNIVTKTRVIPREQTRMQMTGAAANIQAPEIKQPEPQAPQVQPTHALAQQPARRNLPDINSLYGNVELAARNNDLNILLNQEPRPEWILVNQYANGSRYIPVHIIEYLLTSIYTKWRVEIKNCAVIANSVCVTVRLYVLDPVGGEWDWQDGIGASPIQTKQGAAATDFTQVNTAAVQMAAPAAETYAFKDAAEKLGKLFGKDLNRKDMPVSLADNLSKKEQNLSKVQNNIAKLLNTPVNA
jgi:hypothetical protein